MRATLEQTIKFCDFCGERCNYSCHQCGKDMCPACARKGGGVIYWNRATDAAIGTGAYCAACDAELRETKADPVHAAYLAVHELREEWVRFSKAFRRRSLAAEAELARLTGDTPGYETATRALERLGESAPPPHKEK